MFNSFIFYDILQTINILDKKHHSTLGKAITTINKIMFKNIRNRTQLNIVFLLKYQIRRIVLFMFMCIDFVYKNVV